MEMLSKNLLSQSLNQSLLCNYKFYHLRILSTGNQQTASTLCGKKKKTAEFSLSDRSSRERGILNGLTTQLLQQQTLSLSQPTAAAETEMKKKDYI